MAQDSVLRTRLLPPRVPAGMVPRGEVAARLAAALDEGSTVTVTAGAGFGKSVLLATSVAQLRSPWVFLSCDELLDPALLVAHLTAGVEQRFPGFGAGMSTGSSVGLAEEFINELAVAVPEDLVIVLDDVHDLADRASETVLMLARQLPPHVTLAFAGRTPLTASLPTPGRQVLALSEADLALTRDEASALLQADADLDAEQIDDLYARTEGWAAGLALAAQAAARGPVASATSDRDLFDYLAAEVLDAERQDMREFLLRTSILDRFSPRVAAAVSQRDDAAEMCRELVARHLFTARLDAEGEWYRYHALFAEVLKERLAARPPNDLAALHQRAGQALLDDRDHAAAARHLIAAEDFSGAVEAVAPVAAAMALSADAGTLLDLLDGVPEAVWRGQLPLAAARAGALSTVGARARALHEHEQLIALAIEREDWATAADTLMSLALLQGGAGRWDESARFFETTLAQIPTASATVAALHAMAAGSFGFTDDPERVRTHLARAREADASPFSQRFVDAVEVQTTGRLWGQPRPTLEAIDAVAGFFVGVREPALTRPTMFVLLIRAGAYLWFGHYEEAIERFHEVAQFAKDRLGARHTIVPGLWGELVASAGLGRWTDVERLLGEEQAGLARLEDSGVWWAYLQPVRAALAASRGDGTGVRAAAGVARTEIERFSERGWERAAVCTDMANACAALGVDDEAYTFAVQAVHAATAAESPWLEVRSQSAYARVAPDESSAEAALARALEITERHGLDAAWTHRDRRLAPASLARAMTGELGPPGSAARLAATAGAEVFAEVAELIADAPRQTRQALFEAGDRSPTVARQDLVDLIAAEGPDGDSVEARRPPPPRAVQRPHLLRLLSLGGFGLERDGERVPNAAFGRARARAVLAALLSAGGPVPRDQLLEWFWSDLDPERGTRAFHVTMSALRRAVEPGLERGAAPTVVVTEGDSYRVALGEGVAFDAVEFLDLVDSAVGDGNPNGQRAKLTTAIALRGGEPYPEWPYEPWVEGLRGRVGRAHVRALEVLGENLVDHGQAAEALEPLATLVELDPGHEAAHRGLMRAYSATGERARGLRQFHACRSALVREQGVEPSPQTRDLYAQILGDG